MSDDYRRDVQRCRVKSALHGNPFARQVLLLGTVPIFRMIGLYPFLFEASHILGPCLCLREAMSQTKLEVASSMAMCSHYNEQPETLMKILDLMLFSKQGTCVMCPKVSAVQVCKKSHLKGRSAINKPVKQEKHLGLSALWIAILC